MTRELDEGTTEVIVDVETIDCQIVEEAVEGKSYCITKLDGSNGVTCRKLKEQKILDDNIHMLQEIKDSLITPKEEEKEVIESDLVNYARLVWYSDQIGQESDFQGENG